MTLESRPATSAQFRWARATLIAQATGGPVGQAARPLATRSPLVTQPAAQAALLRSGGDLSSLSPETPVGSPSTGRTGRSTTSRSRQGRRPRRRRRQQAGDRIGSDGEATGDEETPGQQWSGQEDGDEVDDDGDLTAGAAHRGDSDQAPPFAIRCAVLGRLGLDIFVHGNEHELAVSNRYCRISSCSATSRRRGVAPQPGRASPLTCAASSWLKPSRKPLILPGV